MDLKTLKIIGFEALIRWNHPVKGIIAPDNFIPLIERTQLIHLLVDWVVDHALAKLVEFKNLNIPTVISINLSGKNFRDPNLANKIISKIKNAKIDPSQLKLEITETVLMDNAEESQKIIKKFRDYGVQIAIDDFGTGYSSLSYLSQFSVDYLKIDRSFISKMNESVFAELIKSTINLAHKLNFIAIAEGVEKKEELDKIIEMGCDLAQGFYFCKPIHQDEVIDYYLKYPEC
jgi:EAL domain-containing protein (putative c-di-GMP-specific phosphodiesterase class I)